MRGDAILELEKHGNEPSIKRLLASVRLEGATDEDIREWWNLPDKQHFEIIEENDAARMASFLSFLEEGYTEKEAVEKTKRGFPVYELYPPKELRKDEDRSLPYELLPRINKYFNSPKNKLLKNEIKSHTSVNAFIREKIRSGEM